MTMGQQQLSAKPERKKIDRRDNGHDEGEYGLDEHDNRWVLELRVKQAEQKRP